MQNQGPIYCAYIEKNWQKRTDPRIIANTIQEAHYPTIHLSHIFQLNFSASKIDKTINLYQYSCRAALSKSHDTATGPKHIHYYYTTETSAWITDALSGSRKTRSTMDRLCILKLLWRIFEWGTYIVSTFNDLEKAYDTTWQYDIMTDLYDMDLRDVFSFFIQNFLSGRVRAGTYLSDVHDQEIGALQGSILSQFRCYHVGFEFLNCNIPIRTDLYWHTSSMNSCVAIVV